MAGVACQAKYRFEFSSHELLDIEGVVVNAGGLIE
jgi:hypothetical protein